MRDAILHQQLTPQHSSIVHIKHHKPIRHTSLDYFGTVSEQGSTAFEQRACLLAACGWDACKLSSLVMSNTSDPNNGSIAALFPGACDMQHSVLGCSMCGARAGLWSFAQLPGQAHSPSPALLEPLSIRIFGSGGFASQHIHIHTPDDCGADCSWLHDYSNRWHVLDL